MKIKVISTKKQKLTVKIQQWVTNHNVSLLLIIVYYFANLRTKMLHFYGFFIYKLILRGFCDWKNWRNFESALILLEGNWFWDVMFGTFTRLKYSLCSKGTI